MKTLALINETAGTVDKIGVDEVRARIEAAVAGADFEIGDAQALIEAAGKAGKYDLVLCAGGDGTQAAVAGALAGEDAAFLPLPCGTVNLFCRDLGLPMDIEGAIDAALGARPALIDIGRIRGEQFAERTFLNNVVFGAYADLAEAREFLRDIETIDDVTFALVHAASALANAQASEFFLDLDGKSHSWRTNTLVISNNAFSESLDFVPRRARLDAGVLAVYLVEAENGAAFTRRLIEFLLRGSETSTKVEVSWAQTCTVAPAQGPSVFSVDGDPEEVEGPVSMTIAPRSLKVLQPAAD